jgi:hypothetical protein
MPSLDLAPFAPEPFFAADGDIADELFFRDKAVFADRCFPISVPLVAAIPIAYRFEMLEEINKQNSPVPGAERVSSESMHVRFPPDAPETGSDMRWHKAACHFAIAIKRVDALELYRDSN